MPWTSKPPNSSEPRPQSGQGTFLKTLGEERREGRRVEKESVPLEGYYLTKVATILEGDTAEIEEMMISHIQMDQGEK
jgi:hypothetical protein